MPYSIVLVPFIALIVAQFIKVVIDATKGEFSWSNLNSYGGWPSAHSAMVAALATIMGTTFGFTSGYFVIALAFAFLTIRDAVGIRWQLGQHAKALNLLVKDLPDYKEDKYPFLQERLGHTFGQVMAGIILGIIIALIF